MRVKRGEKFDDVSMPIESVREREREKREKSEYEETERKREREERIKKCNNVKCDEIDMEK